MSTIQKKTGRNQSMECCKLMAAIFVVFIHAEFPEPLGSAVVCLARFAVPVFFAISGYFSYQVGSSRMPKRIAHILKLYIAAVLACLVCGSIVTVYEGSSLMGYLWGFVPGTENLAKMLLLSESFFPGTMHTWYLLSICACYVLLYFYTKFFDCGQIRYQPLYTVSACLLVLHLLMGEMAPAAGIYLPNTLYRNWLFFGLPMFSMGIFLREYQERILSCFHVTTGKLALMLLAGVVCSLLQWKGVGTGELPFGSILCALSLMLYLISHPEVPVRSAFAKRAVSSLGMVSTAVYILHPPLIRIYETFCLPALASLLSGAEAWLRPVLVALLSILLSSAWTMLHRTFSKRQ